MSRARDIAAGAGLAALLAGPAVAEDDPSQPFYVPGEPVHDEEIFAFFVADRLEYQSREGSPTVVWDVDAWVGQHMNKLWVKSEGEVDLSDGYETISVEPLYSRAISAYWDAQAGIRHDFIRKKDDRTFVSLGFQGLAPGFVETDPTLYVSTEGHVSVSAEVEYDQLLTQRLIFQPRAEIEIQAQDVPEYDLGAGIASVEIGGRLRYEITRQVAPYVGVSWSRAVGETAARRGAAGEDTGFVSFVAGVRLWF